MFEPDLCVLSRQVVACFERRDMSSCKVAANKLMISKAERSLDVGWVSVSWFGVSLARELRRSRNKKGKEKEKDKDKDRGKKKDKEME